MFRVPENQDLFVFSPEVEASLQPWKTYVCVCPEQKPDQSEINTEICHTVLECLEGTVIGLKTCEIQNSRQRLDVRRHERFPRKKREVDGRFVVKVCLAVSFVVVFVCLFFCFFFCFFFFFCFVFLFVCLFVCA